MYKRQVLDGEAAVSEGLIDELGSLSDAMGALDHMIEEGKPKRTGTKTGKKVKK